MSGRNFSETESLTSPAESQRMRVGKDFRRAFFLRDRSRSTRTVFPKCATRVPTTRVSWKSLRADARARFLVLSPSTLTLVRFHVGIDHLSSTEPRRSGEIPIFYPRSGLRCQLDGFVPVWDLYEFRLPTIFTRTVVRARHRVVMILLHVVYMHSNT